MVILVLISILMFVGLNAMHYTRLHNLTQNLVSLILMNRSQINIKKYLKSINNIDDNDINIKILYKKNEPLKIDINIGEVSSRNNQIEQQNINHFLGIETDKFTTISI